jgi:hypothetical protein
MGLTIHYSLKASGGDAEARTLIHALHQTAQDLPFQELGEVVEFSGPECDHDRRDRNDPLRWLLIQATQSVELKSHGRGQTWAEVMPSRLIAFTTWPGTGCEAANFGLGQFPASLNTPRGVIRTGLTGWCWSSFCKTQYASDPQCGGVPHFLRCHLTVIALLDRAKELGCLERVSDEGGFWENRDLPALVQEIGSWNEMIAAFGGKLKDLLGDGPLGVQSAIAQYPNFEQLEAAGQSKLPPGCEELVKLIGKVGAAVATDPALRRATVSSATAP